MPNAIFRRRLQSEVNKALCEYHDARELDHAGLRGRGREIIAERLVKLVLPSYFAVGTGKVVDAGGRQSAETDVIVYSPSVLSPILYSPRDGVFPVEACFIALEVKSRLTASELQDSLVKAKRLKQLDYLPGMHSPSHEAVPHEITPVISAVFAFESDISNKTELQRYGEHDQNWGRDPQIRAICVMGRGYWWFDRERGAWIAHPPADDLEEVVEFLALLANTAIFSFQRRGHPRLGHYLMTNRELSVVRDDATSRTTTISDETDNG